VPVILLAIYGVIGSAVAIGLGGALALLVPLLFYRTSWSLWLMGYFYFLPGKLPANHGATPGDNEE
jgi:hypothetical protein